jgi:hypothetical protein
VLARKKYQYAEEEIPNPESGIPSPKKMISRKNL